VGIDRTRALRLRPAARQVYQQMSLESFHSYLYLFETHSPQT
jgi:hypothetical protein